MEPRKEDTVSKFRRIYYFCPPTHAVENLANRHLKVSRFSGCNDAYELAAFDLRDPKLRKRHRAWLDYADKNFGLICFCQNWTSPVLWGHYAQSHTGLCYGFDVTSENFVDVRYEKERIFPEINTETFFERIGPDQMVDLFATKFDHWSYEEETRLLISFSEPVRQDKLIFHPFSEELKLKQVIIGPRSKITVDSINRAVAGLDVQVFQSRLAFKTYEITRQKNKKLWNYENDNTGGH